MVLGSYNVHSYNAEDLDARRNAVLQSCNTIGLLYQCNVALQYRNTPTPLQRCSTGVPVRGVSGV